MSNCRKAIRKNFLLDGNKEFVVQGLKLKVCSVVGVCTLLSECLYALIGFLLHMQC